MSNNPKIIRIRKAIEITGMPRSTIYYNIRKGTFPASVKISARSVGWVYSEIIAWLNQRMLERSNV